MNRRQCAAARSSGYAPGRDPPDPPVRVIAARVAEIDFAVVDDRVVPVGDVDRAVRAHLDVDRRKARSVEVRKSGICFEMKPDAVVASA